MQNEMTRVVTGRVRFSYVHVFEPTQMDGQQKAKYSAVLLIDKTDEVTLGKMKAAVEAAIERGLPKFGGKRPQNLKLPLRDGDVERPDRPEYAGKMFVTASSEIKPTVVDANLRVIESSVEFYSGCFGRASVQFYAFNTNGNRGVGCALNNIQKTNEGTRLSGTTTAAEDFKDIPVTWEVDEDLPF